MAWWTVVIFSASSSGISISNSSSRAITSSTVSSESAPRSSTNEASFVTCSCLTPSCSATMALTCCSTVLISGWSFVGLTSWGSKTARRRTSAGRRARYCRGTPPGVPLGRVLREWLFLLAKVPVCCSPTGRRRTPVVACGQRLSGHVHPAVDVQRLPRDVGGLGGDQEQYRGGDLLRHPEPPERHARQERRALLLAQRTRHVGVD